MFKAMGRRVDGYPYYVWEDDFREDDEFQDRFINKANVKNVNSDLYSSSTGGGRRQAGVQFPHR